MTSELAANWSSIALAVLSTVAIFLAIITWTRIVGLRSFSKMSSFDFAMTVAVGSTMATVGMGGSSLAVGMAVLATLYLTQVVIALTRQRSAAIADLVDNRPVLLVAHGHLLTDQMRASRVTRSDILAKLREANALDASHVHAVVLETTGDISVLHGDVAPADLDHQLLLDDVRGAEILDLDPADVAGAVPLSG